MSKIKLAVLEDLEDQIKVIQVDYQYRIVDFSIGELLKKYKVKNEIINLNYEEYSSLIVPQYQREFEWGEAMQSKFVESIFMGVPIQPLFAFELDEDGNMELLDGVQRLSTLKAFVDNRLILKNLEEIYFLNGYNYNLLSTSRRRKFLNTSLKFYIINENTDEGVRADIFRRVNEGGIKLSPAQVRKGKFLNNSFYTFILECTELHEFTSLFTSAKEDDKLRGEKEELISRFFAYSNNYKNFQHSVKIFIDNFIVENSELSIEVKKEMKKELVKTLNFISKNIPNGFRKSEGSKSIPRVRFEALSIGVNLALRENSKLEVLDSNWLNSLEFKKWTTSDAANNRSKVLGRIEFVKNCLLNTLTESLTYGD